MIRYILILSLSVAITGGCALQKTISVLPLECEHGRYMVAWNEDTTNSRIIVLFFNQRFALTTVQKDSLQKKEMNYSGHYRLSHDTIYLDYRHAPTADVPPFMGIEASGNYLIQRVGKNDKRMFLRILHCPAL